MEHHAVEPTEFPEREPQQHNFFMCTSPAVRAEIKSPDFSGCGGFVPALFGSCLKVAAMKFVLKERWKAWRLRLIQFDSTTWWSPLAGSLLHRLFNHWRPARRRLNT